jgi:hypothetical protein
VVLAECDRDRHSPCRFCLTALITREDSGGLATAVTFRYGEWQILRDGKSGQKTFWVSAERISCRILRFANGLRFCSTNVSAVGNASCNFHLSKVMKKTASVGIPAAGGDESSLLVEVEAAGDVVLLPSQKFLIVFVARRDETFEARATLENEVRELVQECNTRKRNLTVSPDRRSCFSLSVVLWDCQQKLHGGAS